MDHLTTPIAPRGTDESQEMFQARLERERLAKLEYLFRRFNIPPTDSKALVWALAIKHYAGFCVAKPRGVKAQPEKTADDLILYLGVQRAGSGNILHTIRRLKRHNRWPQKAKALYRRYYELQRAGSREHSRMIELAKLVRPAVLKRIAELEKKSAR